ncbi:MAG: hypothetical protein JHC25_08355 [Thermodesulfobacterium sp.]|nr:hypothetical protein [Thermodesulfobacterium sp.]
MQKVASMPERFSAKPLVLRHGKIALEFELVPREVQQFYLLPVPAPRYWRQRMVVATTTPFYLPEDMEPSENGQKAKPKVKVLPYNGGMWVHPITMWELYKYLSLMVDGEINEFSLVWYDDASKDPKMFWRVPETQDKALLYLVAEGRTKSKEMKRGRIGFNMQELYSFLRYIKAYSQMEVRFISEGKVARFFRWTEDHILYDVETSMGVITMQAREKLLEMLSDYLQGRTDIKPFSMHERILFKVDQETNKFLIIPLMRTPIALSHKEVADLYLFLK